VVHEVFRAGELAERRRSRRADHAGLEVERHHADNALVIQGLAVKHVDTAELRIAIAAILAVAAELELELIQTQMAQKPQYSPLPPMSCSSHTPPRKK
jgi:ABC-type phosphate/phosphonate transport system substrate-binding protein